MAAKMLDGSKKVKTFKYTDIRGAPEEYLLKRPNVFVGTGSEGVLEPGDKILSINNQPTRNLSHVDANSLFRNSGTKASLEIGRSGVAPQSQTDSGMISAPNDEHQKVHSQPYRTASLVMPGPRTINDLGVGAPIYQPYRGPQYNTQIHSKSYIAQPGQLGQQHGQHLGQQLGQQYNSPRPLYSEESLNSTPAHPGYVQSNKLHLPSNKEATISKPHESETFKIVLESELSSAQNQQGIVGKNFEKNNGVDRPSSQMSDRSKGSVDPLMKNSNINQSTTFKKVMYSVLGESEF